jgi:WD repeat-containing protein 48
MDDDASNGVNSSGNSLPMTSLRTIGSSNSISMQAQTEGYIPVAAKGHKESVYALAMNEGGTLLVSGGTEKVLCDIHIRVYVLTVSGFCYYL